MFLFLVGKVEECKEFFRTLYKFIYALGTYLKPHVSWLFSLELLFVSTLLSCLLDFGDQIRFTNKRAIMLVSRST